MEDSQAQTPGLKDRRFDALGNLRVLPDELICAILDNLAVRDVARLSCVSSVMYILCNEEPLWMNLCLRTANGHLQYKGSWKKTVLNLQQLSDEYEERCRKPLHFDGFNSLFLYRRYFRCYTTLDGFSFDSGNVERCKDISLEEFYHEYDGQKPVLLNGLTDTWAARSSWTTDKLLLKYGDIAFRISQRSAKKVTMKFKDYVSYMELQHDEDPLYIFDDKFGEVAPDLLKDYSVPHLFQEDFFDVLDIDQRPPFRWLIIGPERSGASWHVDPALTSAWNTLLCGRKRWALYPPGRVPLGVTVHVNEDDGDVNIDSPTSLQWWLDFYPLLADEDKPIECTQLPGETIFVPSGWWHCVLNLETTVAVTQNFVNSKNFQFVCLDLAPGYRHKGVCRAGLLALDEGSLEDTICDENGLSYLDLTRNSKRFKVDKDVANKKCEDITNGASKSYNLWKQDSFYDINFLALLLDKDRDHFNSLWCSSNCIGQREMRQWLCKLWAEKPGMRELIWKGACLALNASKWSECVAEICAFHNFPSPTEDEKLPVGTGSNPVYLTADRVIKIYVEDGLEASIHGLGTELEFYSLLSKINSPLKDHIPDVLASGILFFENGSYTIVPWDGKGVPDVISKCNLIPEKCMEDDFPFGLWSKKQFEYRKAGISLNESTSSAGGTPVWPYIITKRCKGKIFAQLRDTLSREDELNLASFLGEQLRNLHSLPCPSLNYLPCLDFNQQMDLPFVNGSTETVGQNSRVPAEWEIFIRTLSRKKKDVSNRLTKWGNPIPSTLVEEVDKYIPEDFAKFLNVVQDENGLYKVCKPYSWIHSDIMDDNIYMEPCSVSSITVNGLVKNYDDTKEGVLWRPSHILDFSDLHIGDPIWDLIPIHLDVFRGDPLLLKQFLASYKLPLLRERSQHESVKSDDKFKRLSYHAMCYCILHDDNVLGAIFSIWEDLRNAKSWEEVEETVWGDLNNYIGFC